MPEDIRHVNITFGTVTALKAIIEDIASSLSGKVLCAVMQNYQKMGEIRLYCEGRHLVYIFKCLR